MMRLTVGVFVAVGGFWVLVSSFVDGSFANDGLVMKGAGACCANFELKLDGDFDFDGVGSKITCTSSSIDA